MVANLIWRIVKFQTLNPGSPSCCTRFLKSLSHSITLSVKIVEGYIFDCVASVCDVDSSRSAGVISLYFNVSAFKQNPIFMYFFYTFSHVRYQGVTHNCGIENTWTIFTIRSISSEDFKAGKVMVHMNMILKPYVCPTHNLKTSFIIPGCEGSNCCLDSLTIAESMLEVSTVWVKCSMVTLSKDPETIPSH